MLLKYGPNEWQYREDSGFVMPWYTDRFLRRLINWDVSAWRVLEFGAGYSTIWWASRCAELLTIEHDPDWIEPVNRVLREMCAVECVRASEAGANFCNAADAWGGEFDCVIVDGPGPRAPCIRYGIGRLRDGGVLIVDNTEDIRPDELPGCLRFNERRDFPMTNHPRCMTSYWIITERRSEIPPPEQWRVLQDHPEELVMHAEDVEKP